MFAKQSYRIVTVCEANTIIERFEKSLYDLIRGLRHHKGNERGYIQASLRECRREIKSQDMDLKATALMKLTYLEMFGHDMSWASFNVLEVMSSSKYPQKRVGYLSAVQSFRADTEVLMLAENLLKKDLTSPHPPTISLPLLTIPHVINPSMANSLLSDLLMRLSHSNPNIRKKTIATLYRLALVYPETLRPTWPKLKERLSDENEDPSVTAATVNVICELGWRRPQDFLPLAPRLFDLLVGGSNNWMAIKIIKLFATLTPLEPRLIKKLIPPLTNIIKTTPSMSLLYECINGIVQGGILQSSSASTDGDEIARLCVGKLRGMLVIEGDPNLKYVALLAFNKIVELHPYLVSLHEDVILECVDDGDISIRLCALDLVVDMVNAQNLESIVDRLMRQLRNSPLVSSTDDPNNERVDFEMPTAPDMDDEEAERTIHSESQKSAEPAPLTDDYREGIITRIIDMCSRNTYASINDFDWYIQTLVQMVRHVPAKSPYSALTTNSDERLGQEQSGVAYRIGSELRNVAIRVVTSRREATKAAETLVSIDHSPTLFPPSGTGAEGILEPCVFIVGEFATMLSNPDATLTSLIHPNTQKLPPYVLTSYIQASLKLFAFIAGDDQQIWTPERKTMASLLIARMIHFLEPLTTHSDLQVQELSVSYLELIRLANEAVSAQSTETDDGSFPEPPLLLIQAIPSLFTGMELRPVAPDAQRKVPIPEDLDLDEPINPNLQSLLDIPDPSDLSSSLEEDDDDSEFYNYYHTRPTFKTTTPAEPAANRLALSSTDPLSISYQSSTPDIDPSILEQRRLDRLDRNRDDPFYIPSNSSTQIHNIINASSNTHDEGGAIDDIPILELQLSEEDLAAASKPSQSQPTTQQQQHRIPTPQPPNRKASPAARAQTTILQDEDAPASSSTTPTGTSPRPHSPHPSLSAPQPGRPKKSLLQLDSSLLSSVSINSAAPNAPTTTTTSSTGPSNKPPANPAQKLTHELIQAEEAEMAAALAEVERLRLEMQRRREGVVEGPDMGEVKQSARRRKLKGEKVETTGEEGSTEKKKKKKKKKVGDTPGEGEQVVGVAEGGGGIEGEGGAVVTKKKKKKRRQVTLEGDEGEGDAASTSASASAPLLE